MEQDANHKAIHQVLLALNAVNPPSAVLEFSVLLAAQLEARLHGVFVEDTDLFQVAELPFTREVIFYSAQERRLEGNALRRSVKVMAKRLQTELARVAEGARLSWSFDTIRGRRAALLLEAGTTSDVLIVAQARLREWHVEGSKYRLWARNNIIYLVYTGTSSAERALLAAVTLSRQKDRQLCLLVPQGSKRLALQAAEKLRELHLQANPIVVEVVSPIAVEDICKRALGEAIILPGDIPELQDPIWFQRLLDKIRFPLILVR
jgi:hypothetical protein